MMDYDRQGDFNSWYRLYMYPRMDTVHSPGSVTHVHSSKEKSVDNDAVVGA